MQVDKMCSTLKHICNDHMYAQLFVKIDLISDFNSVSDQGPVGYILSWNIWTYLGKLTFGAYLTHGIWLAVYIYSQQEPVVLSFTTLVSMSRVFFRWLICLMFYGTSSVTLLD